MHNSENQIIVYQPNETVRLDVRLENETVWLTQEQMSLLFGRDQSVIARHINNIFNEGELNKNLVYAKNAYTANDGKTYQVAFYNLDVVIAKKRKGVKLTIFTSEHYDKKHVPHHKISDEDVKIFNAQYPKLTVNYNETFHDRFLIVDDKELYLIGASLKDLGKKCFAFTKLDAGEIARIKRSAFGAEQS